MAAENFKHLLAGGRIGRMDLRNRMVVTAMGASLAEADGRCGPRIIAYHEEQARGGVGLIITGVAGVAWPVGGNQENQIAISDDRFLPGLTALVDAVHRHGGKIAFQLHHGGLVGMTDMLEGKPVWGPSIPDPPTSDFTRVFLASELQEAAFSRITNVDFKVLTQEDIRTVIEQFAAAAVRAVRSGADGAEIHCGHGYLLSSFLSAATNKRTDGYGGPLENRARLSLEVLAAVRAAVGKDFPVWCKLDAEERGRPGGITIEDAIATARMLEKAGADGITVTAYHDTGQLRLHSGSHTPHEPALNIAPASRIKAAIGIPVIASGRIEPEVAEQAIAEGKMDFLSMGRKILADPHLPRKITEGHAANVRPCIYCYTCISAIYLSQPTRCAVNPELGFEYRTRTASGAAPVEKIAVIGGGPGGMESARRLAAAGHRVTLFEKSDQLGGTLRFASLAYPANEKLLDWLREQVAASTVEVRLGTEATPALLRELAPAAVIVATGARRGMPNIPGSDQAHVFSGDDLRRLMLGESSEELKRKTGWTTRLVTKIGAASGASNNLEFIRKATHGWMPLGDNVAIIGGELVGLELAEFLTERKRKVTVVDDVPRFGAGLTVVRRMRLLDELADHGVGLYPSASDIVIGADTVSFRQADGTPRSVAANHVIVAKGASADLELAGELRKAGFVVHDVGDCSGVGYLEKAMRSAANAVEKILSTDAQLAEVS